MFACSSPAGNSRLMRSFKLRIWRVRKEQLSPIIVIDAETFDAATLNGFAIPDELYEWSAHDTAHK